MKKILSLMVISLISVFSLSFAGCGVKGGTLATGIEFVQDVFYVDYNVETFLDYKVYPSTSDNVYVNYVPRGEESIVSYYTFSKGKVKVTNQRFTSIKVTIKMNEYSDECEVRLKRYPNSISFAKAEDYINAGSVYPLDLEGLFGEEPNVEKISCKDSQYRISLTSSNPSVIEIVSTEGLLVRSTGRMGESDITVKMLDSNGKEKTGLSATMKLVVVENITSSFVVIGGNSVNNKSVLPIETAVNGATYRINAYYFGASGFKNEATDIEVYLSNDKVFELLNDADGYYLKLKNLAKLEKDEDYYSVKLTIQSTLLNSSGQPQRFDIELRVRIL